LRSWDSMVGAESSSRGSRPSRAPTRVGSITRAFIVVAPRWTTRGHVVVSNHHRELPRRHRHKADGGDWKYDGRSADSATITIDGKTLAAIAQPGESPILPKPKDPTGKPPDNDHH
jgi:hypothetical protein